MPKEETKIETSRELEPNGGGSLVWEVIKTISGIVIFLLIFRFYIFQPYSIKGSSMETNYHDGEYLIVNEISYHLSAPQRGDVVVFKHPEPACNSYIRKSYLNKVFFQGPCTNYIKRIIGLPGETVTIKNGKVTITNEKNSNGFILDEDYVTVNAQTLGDQSRKLGKDEYFVLGDNRLPNASSDSREWGALPRDHIVGKAFLILLPFDRFSVTKRPTY